MRIRNFLTLTTVILAFYIYAPVSTAAQNLSGLLLTVNNGGDSPDAIPGDRICSDASGSCTLRAAIEESNAGSTRNAIIFDLVQPAVIDLTLGELSISKNLDIVGPGARRLTVRRSMAPGTPDFRIFHIPAGQTTLNIRGITIRNGNDATGGGIFIESGNTVGIIDVGITGNSGTAGGGIMIKSSNLSILRSLIKSNVADNEGGAIVVAGNSAVTIVSSTITENLASTSGAVDNGGNLLLINDTVSRNSATMGSSSILNGPPGTTKALNTIIGRDVGQTVPAIQGQFQSLGHNIVTDSRGSTGFTNGVNGDQVSENNAIDPMLGNLADNGGQTDTLALQTGSPAINTGNDCAAMGQCSQLPGVFIRGRLDQRRYFRLFFAGQIDIGAFEAVSGSVTSGGSFGFFFFGPPGRFLYSIAILINPTTLERRYSVFKLNSVTFQNVPSAEAYVIEIKAKRSGMITPLVIGFD